MCLGLPGKVLRMVDDGRSIAEVEMSGRVMRVSMLLLTGRDRPEPGDYVLVHAGMAVSRVDDDEAAEISRMLEGFGEALAPAQAVP